MNVIWKVVDKKLERIAQGEQSNIDAAIFDSSWKLSAENTWTLKYCLKQNNADFAHVMSAHQKGKEVARAHLPFDVQGVAGMDLHKFITQKYNNALAELKRRAADNGYTLGDTFNMVVVDDLS